MEERLLEYLDAAESALSQYGPQAVDLALWTARIGAIQELAAPLAWLVAFAVAWVWPIRRLWGMAIAIDDDDMQAFAIGGMGALSISAGTGTVAAIACLLNIYAWVGIFRPEIWIAHKALAAVGG